MSGKHSPDKNRSVVSHRDNYARLAQFKAKYDPAICPTSIRISSQQINPLKSEWDGVMKVSHGGNL